MSDGRRRSKYVGSIHGKQEIDGGTCGLLIVWMTVPSMLTRTRHTTEEGYLITPEGAAKEGQPVWVPASSLSAGLVEKYEAAVAAAAAELAAAKAAAAARAASAGQEEGQQKGLFLLAAVAAGKIDILTPVEIDPGDDVVPDERAPLGLSQSQFSQATTAPATSQLSQQVR